MNKYITKIDIECDNIDIYNDTNEIIEEKIFQKVLKYLNNKKAFNVKWNTYKRAHFDAFYFHFKSIKKCVIFFRLNHSLGDGILIAMIGGLVQYQMGDKRYKNKNIDYKNPDDVIPLINHVFEGNTAPNYCM